MALACYESRRVPVHRPRDLFLSVLAVFQSPDSDENYPRMIFDCKVERNFLYGPQGDQVKSPRCGFVLCLADRNDRPVSPGHPASLPDGSGTGVLSRKRFRIRSLQLSRTRWSKIRELLSVNAAVRSDRITAGRSVLTCFLILVIMSESRVNVTFFSVVMVSSCHIPISSPGVRQPPLSAGTIRGEFFACAHAPDVPGRMARIVLILLIFLRD